MPAFYFEARDSDLLLHNKYGVFSKNELENQIKGGHLTIKELGRAYMLTEYQVVHVLRSLGVIYRNNLNDTRIIISDVSPEMHQVLLGTLLGNAFMKEPKAYQLSHSIYQMDYFYHVANKLSPFIATIGDQISKTGESFYLWTYRHDLFVPYFYRFYSRGKIKKYITTESIQGLGPVGLAYWYMDDGKFHEYGAYLCVGKITPEEGSIIVGYLKNTFNIESTFQVHNKELDHYNIYIKAESRDHFFSLIESQIIPGMRYKLDGGAPMRVFSEEQVIEKHTALCRGALRNIRYEGRGSIKDNISMFEGIDYKRGYIKKIQEKMMNGQQVTAVKFREMPSKELLEKMLIEDGMSDDQVAKTIGCGRNRVAVLRSSLCIQDKRKRTFITHEDTAA
jgi:hypothetical protein